MLGPCVGCAKYKRKYVLTVRLTCNFRSIRVIQMVRYGRNDDKRIKRGRRKRVIVSSAVKYNSVRRIYTCTFRRMPTMRRHRLFRDPRTIEPLKRMRTRYRAPTTVYPCWFAHREDDFVFTHRVGSRDSVSHEAAQRYL